MFIQRGRFVRCRPLTTVKTVGRAPSVVTNNRRGAVRRTRGKKSHLVKWAERVGAIALFMFLGWALNAPGFQWPVILGVIGVCAVILGLVFKPWRGN